MEFTLTTDGGIRISGHDFGPAVESAFGGASEYEWAWEVAPEAVPAAVAALGGKPGDDPIRLLKRWSMRNAGDPGLHLKAAGVPIAFWSHVG